MFFFFFWKMELWRSKWETNETERQKHSPDQIFSATMPTGQSIGAINPLLDDTFVRSYFFCYSFDNFRSITFALHYAHCCPPHPCRIPYQSFNKSISMVRSFCRSTWENLWYSLEYNPNWPILRLASAILPHLLFSCHLPNLRGSVAFRPTAFVEP